MREELIIHGLLHRGDTVFRLSSAIKRFRQFAFVRTSLEPFDEFYSKGAIETLPYLKRHTNKPDPKLIILNPCDRAKVNGQCRRLIGKQNAHADVTTAEDLSIAQDRASHQRQVGQDAFADKRSPAEDNRIEKGESMIGSRIRTRFHDSLRGSGLYRDAHCDRYPTLGGETGDETRHDAE
jgi:hypothetical protein